MKCLIIIDALCKHEDWLLDILQIERSKSTFFRTFFQILAVSASKFTKRGPLCDAV